MARGFFQPYASGLSRERRVVLCKDLMHVLAVKNRDKGELTAIFDRNGIRWKEHGADLDGRNPETGERVDADDPELVAYIEILLEPPA